MAEFFNTFGENAMKLLTSVRWYDVLDIITITLIIYYCIKLFRQTRAIHLVRGIVLISLIYLLVSALNMSTSKFVFSKLFDDIVIVLVLLFQPEIRHAIESFGRGDFKKFTFFSKNSELTNEQLRVSASAIAKAASNKVRSAKSLQREARLMRRFQSPSLKTFSIRKHRFTTEP